MTMPGTDYMSKVAEARRERGFLTDYLNREGWYDYPAGQRAGRPQTAQERDFIIRFLSETGKAPTYEEITAWKTGPNAPNRTLYEYLPESTMGQLGFKNFMDYWTAQQHGATYGPYAGSRVPEGGVVTTRDNKPYFRTFDPEEITRYTEAGRTISPEDEIAERYYPRYERTPQTPQTPEEALSVFSPQQVYEVRLYDYLDQQVQRDSTAVNQVINNYNLEIDRINEQSLKGEIDSDQAKLMKFNLDKDTSALLEEYMTREKAEALYDEALQKRDRGYQVETLPFWEEIQGIMGPKTNELMNRGLEEFATREKQRIAEIPRYREPPTEPLQEYRTGNEQRQYLSWVEGLDTTQELKDYLRDRFWYYYGFWEANPGEPFMSWLIKTLGGY